MTRLRKAGRLWRNWQAQAAALEVLVNAGDTQPGFKVELERWFGRSAPLEVELGAGKGEFIIEQARTFPNRNFLAVELPLSIVRLLCARVARSGLGNLKVLRADARSLVGFLMPSESVDVYHIYYPDPWPKARHAKHRLFSPNFVAGLARTLKEGGILCVASDVEQWALQIFESLRQGGFEPQIQPVVGATKTGYGKKYLAEKRTIFACAFKRPTLKNCQNIPLAEQTKAPLCYKLWTGCPIREPLPWPLVHNFADFRK